MSVSLVRVVRVRGRKESADESLSHLPNITHTASSEAAPGPGGLWRPGTYTVYISVLAYSREKSYQGYLEPVKRHINI